MVRRVAKKSGEIVKVTVSIASASADVGSTLAVTAATGTSRLFTGAAEAAATLVTPGRSRHFASARSRMPPPRAASAAGIVSRNEIRSRGSRCGSRFCRATSVRVSSPASTAAHAHYLGREMLAVATLPDGTTRQLLWIRDWDFNWHDRYDFLTPIPLPKGSRVNVRISFDNTEENPRNPSRPPRRVRFGGESLDEMGGIQFQMVTTEKSDEAVLQQIAGAALRAALLRLRDQFQPR